MTLLKLLKRWSELEPDRARFQGDDFQVLSRHGNSEIWISIYHLKWSLDRPHALGLVQSAVQAAISSRGLRMQLENSLDGWKVVLLHPDRGGAAILSLDKEAAIALLTAYVKWLEKNQEVTA